jgi:lipopolysaccharide export system protein LptA
MSARPAPRRRFGVLLPALAAALLLAPPAFAQGLNLGGKSDQPIEITADNGIEWQQENMVFLARGNAKAVRGEVTVLADELRAYYREQKEGGTEIWRLDAIGNVRIKAAQDTAYGRHAIYQVDIGVLVLTGGKVKLVTSTDVITADKQIEYWEQKQMAVARGNALAVRENRKLKAEVLAAYFRADRDKNENKLFRVDAFDNVTIVTEQDTATADRGVYNVESGIATLTGSVKLTRGENVLTGCRAEVNMNTSVSNLYSCPGAGVGPRERAKGTLMPKNLKIKKSQ